MMKSCHIIFLVIAVLIIIACLSRCKCSDNNAEHLTEHLNQKEFVLFYAPWCGHCKAIKPTWTKLQNEYKGSVKVVDIDADADTKTAKKHKINGFPTIKYFPNGRDDIESAEEYKGGRSYDDLVGFLNSKE